MMGDNLDEQRVFESIGSDVEIGIVWRVNLINTEKERTQGFAWSHISKQKSTTFFITRADAIEDLRTYHKNKMLLTQVKPRPTMDQSLMRMAELMSQRATCTRAQVGAIIVKETRLVSSGYNGTAAGLPHCNHACDCTVLPSPSDPKHHWADCSVNQPCRLSVHAEANAIAFAAKHGVSTEGTTIYTTMAPCLECAKLILNAGIVRVVAASQYRDDSGTRLLLSLGITVDAELL